MPDPIRIFEMTPRQFAGVATFGLVLLVVLMFFSVALVQVVR